MTFSDESCKDSITVLTTDPEDIRYLRGVEIGKARYEGTEEVVVRINGYPVTSADFLEARARMVVDVLEEKEFEREHPDAERAYEDMPSRYELVEEHGVDAAAFATFIAQYAPLSTALKAGHGASDEEVAKLMEEQRERFDKMGQEEIVGEVWSDILQITLTKTVVYSRNRQLEGYVSAVGEDEYWCQVLPARLRLQHTTSDWLADATHGLGMDDMFRVVNRSLKSTLVDAEVDVVRGEFNLGATPEEAVAYLQDYWDWLYLRPISEVAAAATSTSETTRGEVLTSPTPAPASWWMRLDQPATPMPNR